MPIPKPKTNESKDAFIARCMADPVMASEYKDGKQRAAICYSQWRGKSMTPNEQLLAAIRQRSKKQVPFGRGILTADRYVKGLADVIGLDACYKHMSSRQQSFDDLVQKASETLVYSNDDMVLEEATATASRFKAMMEGAPDGAELPKNTLMVFRHKLTTTTEDRDRDILHAIGMELDPKMLLLWQHVHTMPIGKYVYTYDQNEKSISVVSTIIDMNETTHDAAVMVDNGMGRFSHGFRALDFEKRKSKGGKESGGFEIHRAEIMEESLVSVPANPDAQTEEVLLSLVEGGKLTSPVMKEFGRQVRTKQKTQIAVPGIKFRERLGDYQRELQCSSLSDLKSAVDAGLIGVTEEEGNHEDEPRTEAGGSGGEKGAADASKEADGGGRKAEDGGEGSAGDEKVKCPKCGSTNIKDGKCQDCGAELPAAKEPMKSVKATEAEQEQQQQAKGKNVKCPKCGYTAPMNYWSPGRGDGGYKCPECKADMSSVFPESFRSPPDDEKKPKKDTEPSGEKAGRVLSRVNESKIREALADLREAHSTPELARPLRALIHSAYSSLDAVVGALGDEGKTSEQELNVKAAAALFISEAGPEERERMSEVLQTLENIDKRNKRTKRFKKLTRRDVRGGLSE